MKKTNDVKELIKLVSAHMKKGVATNNFLTVDDYEKAASKDALFYEEWRDGIFVIRKRDGFFVVNFHLNSFEQFPLSGDGVYICEISGKGDIDAAVKEYFLKNGFCEYKKRVRLTRKNEPAYYLESDGAGFCGADGAKAAYEIMAGNFDKYSGCVPSFEEFLADVKEQRVIVYQKDSVICGILHFRVSGKTSEIRHLAVSPYARGQGAAARMIRLYHDTLSASRFFVWTGADNDIAIKLYTDNGYEKDGVISEVMKGGENGG